MLPHLWTRGLHNQRIASVTLKPLQGIDLPINDSFLVLTYNAPNPRNNSMFSSVTVRPLSFPKLNQMSSGLGAGSYPCSKSKFGQPTNDSCKEAHTYSRRDQEVLNYRDRTVSGTTNAMEVLLPL